MQAEFLEPAPPPPAPTSPPEPRPQLDGQDSLRDFVMEAAPEPRKKLKHVPWLAKPQFPLKNKGLDLQTKDKRR